MGSWKKGSREKGVGPRGFTNASFQGHATTRRRNEEKIRVYWNLSETLRRCAVAWNFLPFGVNVSGLGLFAFEVLPDFLERFAFGFRQEEGGGDEIDHCAGGPPAANA